MDEEQLSLKWNNHKTKFFENLKIQREKSNYTDATIAVDGKFYPVHKLVMSTCSEYFSDIFERTPCKSPVIVLKDVQSHDIEALLDYMYLGEVNVNQNHLASLLKTAECLRIKGLAVPDEDTTKLIKNTTSIHDNVSLDRPDSPPLKRRRHDSNIISLCADSPVPSSHKSISSLVSPTQTFALPPQPSSNTEKNESLVVKDEMEEVEESNTELQHPPVVKIETDDDDEPEEVFRRKNNYEEFTRSDKDPLGDFRSDISKTEHELENYGNTSFPGSSVQHSGEDYWDEGDSNSFPTESYSGDVPTSQQLQLQGDTLRAHEETFMRPENFCHSVPPGGPPSRPEVELIELDIHILRSHLISLVQYCFRKLGKTVRYKNEPRPYFWPSDKEYKNPKTGFAKQELEEIIDHIHTVIEISLLK